MEQAKLSVFDRFEIFEQLHRYQACIDNDAGRVSAAHSVFPLRKMRHDVGTFVIEAAGENEATVVWRRIDDFQKLVAHPFPFSAQKKPPRQQTFTLHL